MKEKGMASHPHDPLDLLSVINAEASIYSLWALTR